MSYNRERDYRESSTNSRSNRSSGTSSRGDRFRDREFDYPSNNNRNDINDNHPDQHPPPPKKEKPNFGLSGKLATEANTTSRGIVLKYSEPPEARPPSDRWRLYIFKGDQEVGIHHLHRQSAYRIGRDRAVADIPADHPSISKQHAVLQFRQSNEGKSGSTLVKLYIIDLESANGTFINGEQIEPKRYYEIKAEDGIRFGTSSREYVFIKEKSKS